VALACQCHKFSPGDTISSTWAYRKNLGVDNEVVKFKARICAQEFRQTFGLNFESKYAPTGKPASLCLLILHAVNHGYIFHQLNIKSAFLTCDLEEEVYMLPPPGYLSGQDVVLKLCKAIYGLKQASLAWYRRLSTFLLSVGFAVSVADPCVFWRTSPSPLWIFAHVDNLIIVGVDPLAFRVQMEKEFQIKYLGDTSFLLGMKLDRSNDGFFLNQSQYIQRKLVEFAAENLPHASCPLDPKTHLSQASELDVNQFQALAINYWAIIGSLNYLSVLTCPYISFAVSKLSQFLERPGLSHYKAAMQVFQYLHGTMHCGLLFLKTANPQLCVFVDANWANCSDTHQSHSGFLVLRSNHLLSWKLTKQTTVSLSSTEAEYKSLADTCKDTVWLKNLCQEVFQSEKLISTSVFFDNPGAIDLSLSQVSQNGFQTKHMDLFLHFIRDLVSQKTSLSSSSVPTATSLIFSQNQLVNQKSLTLYLSSPRAFRASLLQAPTLKACQPVKMTTWPQLMLT
jgi:hypothetical protein